MQRSLLAVIIASSFVLTSCAPQSPQTSSTQPAASAEPAASGSPASPFETQLEDVGLVIVKFHDKTATAVVVPAQIDGRPVTAIGERAFWGCDALQSIEIPASVQTIGESAFWGCDALQSAKISDGVQTIGERAFWGCAALQSIKIPASVQTIDESAFWGCDALQSIEIPASVQTLNLGAFKSCGALTSFSVAPGNKRFSSVDGVLFTADGKTLIAFPRNKETTRYVVPDNVETIGESAFEDCDALQSIEIPDGVQTIGFGAFLECDALQSVEIPASVQTIGFGAFLGCDALTSFSVAPDNMRFSSVDGVLFTADGKTLIAFPRNKETTRYVVPDNVEIIGMYAFFGCDALTSVVLPDGVLAIGGSAFGECDALQSVEIPASVQIIGEDAFEARSDLTLYGAADSYAELYAEHKLFRFEAR